VGRMVVWISRGKTVRASSSKSDSFQEKYGYSIRAMRSPLGFSISKAVFDRSSLQHYMHQYAQSKVRLASWKYFMPMVFRSRKRTGCYLKTPAACSARA
jgi:hypothetical protein